MAAGNDSYLLNLRGVNWSFALGGWAWILPRPISLLFVNRFGDTFLKTQDESVQMLNLASGKLEKLANTLRDFTDLMEMDVLREAWLMTRLCDECIEAGLELGPGQVYGYKIAPALGGKFERANVQVTDIQTHFSTLAAIQRRLARE